jgi:hypothetical protein
MGNNIFRKPKEQVTPLNTPSLQEQIDILRKRKEHLEKLILIYSNKSDSEDVDNLKNHYEIELKKIERMLNTIK